MKTYKIVSSIFFGGLILYFIIVNNQSTIDYFNRIPISGFDEVLTKNRDVLAEMDIDKIRFITNNYSGNSAGREALSLTIYLKSSISNDEIYLRGESIKLNGIKAVLKDGRWIVYGTEKVKAFDKQEIKSLFESCVINFIETRKVNHINAMKWTSQVP